MVMTGGWCMALFYSHHFYRSVDVYSWENFRSMGDVPLPNLTTAAMFHTVSMKGIYYRF